MINSTIKHILHCLLLFSIIFLFYVTSRSRSASVDIDPWEEYGTSWTIFLYSIRLLTIMTLPQMITNFLGLVMYNAFPEKVVLKSSPLLAPLICIRVVTRGEKI